MRRGLEIVADLENPRILKERAQFLDRQLQRQLALTRLGNPAHKRQGGGLGLGCAMADGHIGRKAGR